MTTQWSVGSWIRGWTRKTTLVGKLSKSNKIYRRVNSFVRMLIFIFDDIIVKLKSENLDHYQITDSNGEQ